MLNDKHFSWWVIHLECIMCRDVKVLWTFIKTISLTVYVSFLSFDQSKTDTYNSLMKFEVKRKFLKDRLNRYLWGGDVAAIQS